MLKILLRRARDLVVVLWVVGTVMFVVIRLVPGDPAVSILGETADPQQLATLRDSLGLSGTWFEQYGAWLGRVLSGDLGSSITFSGPVLPVIIGHIAPTLTLALFSTVISFAIALGITLWGTVRPRSPAARSVTQTASLGMALPQFWVALIVILIFAMVLRWFPPSGYADLLADPVAAVPYLVLPVTVLVIGDVAVYLVFLRESVMNEMSQLYLRTARSKGLSETRVAIGHAVPNALMPVLTVMGGHFATLVGGVVIVETVFVIPGLGSLALQAISTRDYPLVQGVTLFVTLMFVVVNLLVDLSYALIDPKVRVS
ncbi:peptide ABC transporter permease [Sphaerisporangium siamense]|uniref:Peptide/nickel transport system permease protein n=1 Tax=Sphaerisporangium siamense TaxID=795645 RepID=A0A7W7D441_9ACTN|nr:ABC transporter permease [Sphaerisporangium siamense]MBB4699822.1 peptide/nickel transport system permease protein [Sphaerisporangium siamense]GII84858.1 peptide ABC transporter permease [Sphaerisporangium siamense]